MRREFEEVGVEIAGNTWGHFTGSAEWDDFGQVVTIDVEQSGFGNASLRLDIADLVRERGVLRRKYGAAWLEENDREVQANARMWFLFHGLSEALQAIFAEDVLEDQRELRAERRRGAA